MDDLTNASLASLRQMAKDLGINGCSAKKKSELIEILSEYKAKNTATERKPEADRNRKTASKQKAVDTEKKSSDVQPKPSIEEQQASDLQTQKPNVQTQTRNTQSMRPSSQTVVRRVVGNPIRRPAQEMSAVNGDGTQQHRPEENVRNNIQHRVMDEPSRYDTQQRVSEENAKYGNQSQRNEASQYDSGITKTGILEIMPEQSFGFIRNENYLPSPDDVYVSPQIIKRYNLTTGDIISGNLKVKSPAEKFVALLYVTKINGENPELSVRRKRFDKLTPVFPHERLRLETEGGPVSTRIVDLLAPVGKGQRGMIVSPPKAGKTTLLKDIARAIQKNNPKLHMIILLIDERPEEVTDMKDCIKGDNVEIIYSTFDEAPEQHKRVSEMTVEHAKRLVEYGKDVIILLDSITRLARAYNLTCQSSGRTLSGGLDPAALYMPKRFFGAARCMKEGGSLTILATALVDTGSRMDDVVFEEFKGTGNMELTLNRALSERRIFPAIDLPKSSTRREDLLLSPVEQEANFIMRRAFGGARAEEATEQIVNMFTHTRSNAEFITQLKRTKLFG